jgi:uncharacterized YigZ family protein
LTGYLAPAGYGEAELTEKRSRFIGRIWQVQTEEEAAAHLAETRKKDGDAKHHVSAFLLREGGVMRCCDDGEPGGTAGMPVLNVLRGAGLQNACCVVTRYFGGILLGAGGLVRAYSAAAGLALEAAGVASFSLWRTGRLCCPYPLYERLRRLLEAQGAAVDEAVFGAGVDLSLAVPEENAEALAAALRNLSAGSVEIAYIGERFLGKSRTEK